MARALSPLQWLFIALVRVYQYCISPFLGPACRFYPSCSHYAVDAIRKHGCFYGVWLTCKRLLRCHPLCTGGVDPVPEPKHKNTEA